MGKAQRLKPCFTYKSYWEHDDDSQSSQTQVINVAIGILRLSIRIFQLVILNICNPSILRVALKCSNCRFLQGS